MDVTEGHLLGGRVRYRQPSKGFRSGIEPVLLAACIPARTGQRVLEAGTGAGAALLCLAARVPGIVGLGVEIDPALAELANANAAANGFTGLRFIAADIAAMPDEGNFDHAFANPPYHRAGGTPPESAARALAKVAAADLFGVWIAALAARLRPRGTLSLILPADAVPNCLEVLATARCGGARLFPLWPRQGVAAKLVLLQATHGGHAPFGVLPGLALHEGTGFSAAAETILRHGEPLPLDRTSGRRQRNRELG